MCCDHLCGKHCFQLILWPNATQGCCQTLAALKVGKPLNFTCTSRLYQEGSRQLRTRYTQSFTQLVKKTALVTRSASSDWINRPRFFFAHLAWAALRAFALRCAAVSFLAEALPPLRPSSTAATSFFLIMCLVITAM